MKTLWSIILLAALIVWVIPTDELPAQTTEYIDLHVHTAGLGIGASGAFVSEEVSSSYKFPIYLWAMGVTQEELDEHGDALVIRRIAEHVEQSQRVAKAVVLAMDGVIDDHGALDQLRTQIYVPNEFVARETARYPNLLFGASINPRREDAIDRLRRAKANGAMLVKWIPNIMLIDPSDPTFIGFYREMVKLDLPLLTHAGQERSFAGADDTLGDPQKLRLPLTEGVKVIAAHIATTGDNDGEANYERIIPMFDEFANLYTEISSLTQVNKRSYLVDALKQRGLTERMLYGTDWPLQFSALVSPLYHFDELSIGRMKAVLAIDNPWDRDVALKEALGVETSTFERSRRYLQID
jgi:predicted TIM-barrel fold metal-dependent hydrolase